MAVRERLSSLLERTVSGVRSALNEGSEVDHEALQAHLRTMTDLAERVASLEAQLETLTAADQGLDKRLNMVMGAVQATTAQLMEVKRGLAEVRNQSQQAMQRATTAMSTAESAAEGITDVEQRLPAEG